MSSIGDCTDGSTKGKGFTTLFLALRLCVLCDLCHSHVSCLMSFNALLCTVLINYRPFIKTIQKTKKEKHLITVCHDSTCIAKEINPSIHQNYTDGY